MVERLKTLKSQGLMSAKADAPVRATAIKNTFDLCMVSLSSAGLSPLVSWSIQRTESGSSKSDGRGLRASGISQSERVEEGVSQGAGSGLSGLSGGSQRERVA